VKYRCIAGEQGRAEMILGELHIHRRAGCGASLQHINALIKRKPEWQLPHTPGTPEKTRKSR
jgi:hypothetical protein